MGPLIHDSPMRCYVCREVTQDNWMLVSDSERVGDALGLYHIDDPQGLHLFMTPDDVSLIPPSIHLTQVEIQDGRFDDLVVVCEFCTNLAFNPEDDDRNHFEFTGHEGWLKEWNNA